MFCRQATDFKDGDRRIVVSGKHEVGVVLQDGSYYAYSNYCCLPAARLRGILVNKVAYRCRPHLRRPDFTDQLHFVCP